MNVLADMKRSDAVLLGMSAILLFLCFYSGGDSAHDNPGMVASQLLAIPILVHALILCARRNRLVSARWGALIALLVAALPLLQLLPVPESIWSLPPARSLLSQDLASAGVTAGDQRWTLSLGATERGFCFLLPGLALFFCMLACGRTAWRSMLWLIIVLGSANLVLAIAQMAAGRGSVLNLYPEFAAGLGGIFANSNHQASMLAMVLMLVAVFLLDAWRKMRENHGSALSVGALAIVGTVLVFSLPAVGSRAGVIISMIMLMAVLLSSGLPSFEALRKSRFLQVGSLLAFMVFLAGLHAAIAWMKSDSGIEGSRYMIMTETLRIGAEYAPLGAGYGTFVPAFQAGLSETFLTNKYVNNAHNEYAQWWLEGGIVAVFVVMLTLATLLMTLIRLLRLRVGSRTRTCGIAAMMGIGVVVLHSSVDYPLRTPALMAVFAVLSGIAIAAAAKGSSSPPRPARELVG